MNSKTLYISDLDGTLLDSAAALSDFSRNGLKSLCESSLVRPYSVHSRAAERRDKSRMDIDDAVGILSNDLGSHQRQVAREHDKLCSGLVNSLNDCFIPRLERAANNGIRSCVVSKKDFESIEAWDEAVLKAVDESGAELIVLAGYLSLMGPKVVSRYSNRIINIHPALMPYMPAPQKDGIRAG